MPAENWEAIPLKRLWQEQSRVLMKVFAKSGSLVRILGRMVEILELPYLSSFGNWWRLFPRAAGSTDYDS